jgi:hypothetical protein
MPGGTNRLRRLQQYGAIRARVINHNHCLPLCADLSLLFMCSSMHLIRTVANLVAPYAAVLFKYQQIQSTRSMLEQLLPTRVVAAAIDRLAIGGSSLNNLFVPTHQDVQQSG